MSIMTEEEILFRRRVFEILAPLKQQVEYLQDTLVELEEKLEKVSLLGLPDGLNKDLPELGQTTMWHSDKKCPVNKYHVMAESSRRIYCPDCGVYWNK